MHRSPSFRGGDDFAVIDLFRTPFYKPFAHRCPRHDNWAGRRYDGAVGCLAGLDPYARLRRASGSVRLCGRHAGVVPGGMCPRFASGVAARCSSSPAAQLSWRGDFRCPSHLPWLKCEAPIPPGPRWIGLRADRNPLQAHSSDMSRARVPPSPSAKTGAKPARRHNSWARRSI
jgi:hypothetical protein